MTADESMPTGPTVPEPPAEASRETVVLSPVVRPTVPADAARETVVLGALPLDAPPAEPVPADLLPADLLAASAADAVAATPVEPMADVPVAAPPGPVVTPAAPAAARETVVMSQSWPAAAPSAPVSAEPMPTPPMASPMASPAAAGAAPADFEHAAAGDSGLGPPPAPGASVPLGPIGAPEPAPADPAKIRAAKRRNIIEWVVILSVAITVSFVIKATAAQAYFIPSGSMEDTLDIGDRVMVNKLSYDLHPIHRGDIVVFTRTPGFSSSDIKDLIKRVIAVGGDTVETRSDNKVYVNDRPLDEPYLDLDKGFGPAVSRITIPPHMLWVMGDHRGDSADSRFFGPIKESQVVGRAFVRIWPFTRLGTL